MDGTVRTATMRRHVSAAVQRIGVSFLILAVLAYVLRDRIMRVDFELAWNALEALRAEQWFGAFGATATSFWAIGRYDAVVHQHLGTHVRPTEARRAGTIAIAISQTVGAGVFTGALVRWRMLRGTSLWQATRIAVAVTLCFLTGWAVVTGAVLTMLASGTLWQVGMCMWVAGLVVFALGLWQPQALRRLHLPNALIQGRLIGLTVIDTFAACLALYLLLPDLVALPFSAMLPAFLIAIGIGLVSGSPGGVGPFEVALIALLPQVPEGPLLAAIMGWRVVYFAVPAVIAAILALGGPVASARGGDPVLRGVSLARQNTLLARSHRAEAGLARQGHLSVMDSRLGGAWLTGRTAHALIGLFDPIGSDQPQRAALRALALQAQGEGRVAAIYKCSPRTAAIARSIGWRVLAVGAEAMVNPSTFSMQGHTHAALRRKLRRAEAGRVTLHPGDARGAAERAAIARLWARARKGERGFSMGRYAETYIARQLVIEARQDGRLVAFATFHQGRKEWTLDLMRSAPDCPDGTMHAIVTHAILRAHAAGIGRFCLAAAGTPAGVPDWVGRRIGADQAGLQQFKQMFAPQWQPLYMTAPSGWALGIAGAEIARAVLAPPPVHPLQPPHHDLAPNEFARGTQAWHMGA